MRKRGLGYIKGLFGPCKIKKKEKNLENNFFSLFGLRKVKREKE